MNGEKRKQKWPLIVGIGLLTLGAATAWFYWVNIVQPNIARGEAIGCRSRLRQIALAGGLWAIDHGDRFPTNFTAMYAELNNPAIFACPKEKSNPLHLAKDWSAFDPKQSNYEIVSPGLDSRFGTVFARCRIHGFACDGDGTVQDDIWKMRRSDLAEAKLILLVAGMCFLFGIGFLMYSFHLWRKRQPHVEVGR